LGSDQLAIQLKYLAVEILKALAHLVVRVSGVSRQHGVLAHELLGRRAIESGFDGVRDTRIPLRRSGPTLD